MTYYRKAQGHSKDKVFERFPGEKTKGVDHESFSPNARDKRNMLSPSSPAVESPFITVTELTERTPPRAMLRPLFRESDAANWKKAAVINSKWVGLLDEEQMRDFYSNCAPSEGGPVDGGDDASASRNGNSTARTQPDLESAELSSVVSIDNPDARMNPLGVAVIKNAVVVDSTAYLQVAHLLTAPHRNVCTVLYSFIIAVDMA